MSRHVKDAPITTPTSRAKLPIRAKPYFRSLDPKLCLGYRKSKDGGHWLLRAYDGNGRYHQEEIGVADDHQKADGDAVLDFGQASKVARDRYTRRHRRRKALPEDPTGSYKVRQAVADYVQYLQDERKSGKTVEHRLNVYIEVNGLTEVECDDLTNPILVKWRSDIAKMPARRRTYRGKQKYFKFNLKDPEHVRARRASANWMFAMLRAALNHARRAQKITFDSAWSKVEPFSETDKPRLRYLEFEEVARLLNAAQDALHDFLCGGLHTGARPSEIARLEVRDFHAPSGTLHIVKSKGARERYVVLSLEGKEFFRDVCSGRKGTDLIFIRDNGLPWKRHSWRIETNSASRAAGIEDMTFYTLRHTYCSHAVMDGMPLLVLAKNLGHVDIEMVQKHYGHLSDDYVARETREHAPTYGCAASKHGRASIPA